MSAESTNTNPTNGTEIQKKPKSAALAVKDWMAQPTMRNALAAALTGYMDVETFAAQCYIAAQNPDLAACSAESLFKAFLECAQMGLLPGTHHRHVALVPRKGIITVTPQWQGFKFLMERQPGIKRVTPVLVHVNDEFSIENDVVTHKFDPFDDTRVFEHPDEAKNAKRASGLRGGYLKVEHTDGEVQYHFVSARKINANRVCAETQGIWKRWFEEQCRKTVVRDAWSKRFVAVDPELAARVGAADDTDNRALGNDPARVARMLGAGGAEDVPDMSKVPTEATPTGKAALGLGDGARAPSIVDEAQAAVAATVPAASE